MCLSANDALEPGTKLGYYHTDFFPFMGTDQLPLMISPGECIYVLNDTANASFEVSFMWAEIPAYKAEL